MHVNLRKAKKNNFSGWVSPPRWLRQSWTRSDISQSRTWHEHLRSEAYTLLFSSCRQAICCKCTGIVSCNTLSVTNRRNKNCSHSFLEKALWTIFKSNRLRNKFFHRSTLKLLLRRQAPEMKRFEKGGIHLRTDMTSKTDQRA